MGFGLRPTARDIPSHLPGVPSGAKLDRSSGAGSAALLTPWAS
jgi:hypothetical protein